MRSTRKTLWVKSESKAALGNLEIQRSKTPESQQQAHPDHVSSASQHTPSESHPRFSSSRYNNCRSTCFTVCIAEVLVGWVA